MLDSTLALEPIVAALQEFVQETLREQNATFKERVDEMNLLKDELSQIVKESFILSADAQKSNESKIGKLLAQFEAAVTDTLAKIDTASQKSEERAEREGTYSMLAQKNLDRAGKFSCGMFALSCILFGWTVIHFSNVRRDVESELTAAKAALLQINAEVDSKKELYTKMNKQGKLKS